MMNKMVVVCAVSLVCGVACADLAEFADPFVGTAGTGHTFPAACVPFGMVQAGPIRGIPGGSIAVDTFLARRRSADLRRRT